MSPLMVRQAGRPLIIGVPLFIFAFDFIFLVVTYLVLAPIAPDVLGDVAVSPARFATWIALVQLPMTLAHMFAISWRGWVAVVVRDEVPDPPLREGWRWTLVRMRDWVAHAAWSVVAALIVFEYVADPGDAYLWQLVAVSAVGPLLVPRAVSGLVWLLRWWRRHTSHTNEPRIPSA